MMLTLALLFVAVGGAKIYAGKYHAVMQKSWYCNASWNSGINTMSWTGVWTPPAGAFGSTFYFLDTNLPSGDITSYTNFHATLSNFSDNVDHIWLRIKQGDNNYADAKLVAGENNIDLAALATANPGVDFTKVTDITLWGAREALAEKTIDGEHPASVVITNVYLYKPTDVVICTGFGDAVTSLDYITDGGKFIISDNGAKAIYYTGNQDYKNSAYALVPNDSYFYMKLEKVDDSGVEGDNIYRIRIQNGDGTDYPNGISGGSYVNITSWGSMFSGTSASGANKGYGVDGKNWGLWYVTYDAEKGFSFQNVGREKWMKVDGTADDQQYLKLYKSLGFTVNSELDPIDENVEITVGGDARNYQLYVPNTVQANCPLVISLHGAGGASTNYSPFKKSVADAEGCIVAYPQGKVTNFPIGFGDDATGWTASGEDNFDVDFIKAVIEDVASKYQIDRKRIYCCGFSNGGMMTYALSNTCSDIFAAFASISGYPINEFHLRHAGARPVPFLHIHGKADNFVLYSKMPTIVDEMVARLGANPVPTTTTVDGKYTKNVYQAGDGSFPYVYYEVDGMGHNDYTVNTEEGNSAQTMWNFFEQYTLDSSCDETLKWAPRIEEAGFTPASHGWTMNDGTTLLQFGGDQYTVDNKNVYHSLQFDNGNYLLSFSSTGAAVSMGVKIQKLTSPNTVVLNEIVKVGDDVVLPFEITDGWGEYQLTITRLFASNPITISNVVIKEGSVSGGGTSGEATSNHYLEITTNSVKDNAWEWAIWYDLETPLVKGEKYVLTMDAICSESYDIAFWPNKKGGGTTYTGYKIGTEWGACTCEFTAGDDLDRLSWNFGSLNGFLRFDNVKLVKKGETTNLITGGDFESGLDSHWGDDGWNKPEYGVYETAAKPSKYLKMTTNAVKENAWEWAVWYRLDTPLVKDKTYVLTMKAKCSEAYNMPFWPYKTGDGGKTNYTGYNIGTEWGDCSCTFTAADDLTHLKWCFGSLNGTVCFDDVKLVEQGYTTNLINGGDFENGLASNWGDDSWNKPQYSVVIEYPEVTAQVPIPETQLTPSMFKSWSSPDADATITSNSPYFAALSYGETGTGGSCFYGSGNVSYLDYADLSKYSAMKIYGTGSNLRIMMNRVTDGGALTEVQVTPSVEGTVLDLSSYPFVHLNAIKVVNGGGETTITDITLIDPSVTSEVDYVLSGDIKDGASSGVLTAALADTETKVIDVTGVTGSGVELISANPNCLFVSNAGTLTNDHNVIVSGACEQLTITDGYSFKAPIDFTATAVPTYGRSFTSSTTTTVCLPFALTETEAETLGTFYELSSFDGGTIHLSPVAEPEANKAYLVVPTATGLTLSEAGKSIAATPADLGAEITSVEFIGTLASTSIPASDETNSYFAFNNGSLVKIATNAATLPAFRGYFKVSTSAIGARSLNISFDEETTGVKTIDSKSFGVSKYFDLQGRRVENPTKGLYIVNGKKVVK